MFGMRMKDDSTWATLGQYVRRLVRAAEIEALEWALHQCSVHDDSAVIRAEIKRMKTL